MADLQAVVNVSGVPDRRCTVAARSWTTECGAVTTQLEEDGLAFHDVNAVRGSRTTGDSLPAASLRCGIFVAKPLDDVPGAIFRDGFTAAGFAV